MSGWAATSLTPSAPSTRNHTTMTGPNSPPTAPVPNRWSAKSPTSTASERGTICAASAGEATCRPDTAETTEIAGVSIPSP
jgi:hypothetical protein